MGKVILTEHQIMSLIHDFLRYKGLAVWRMNTGAVKSEYTYKTGPKKGTTKSRMVRFATPGFADLVGIYKGRFMAIEVKRPSTKKDLTPWQESFLETVKLKGGIAFVATSIEDVEKELGL